MKLSIINITAGGISGGYRKYLENVLPRLSQNPSMEKILCCLPPEIALNNIPQRSHDVEFIDIAPYKITNAKVHAELRKALDKFQPDVVYVPVERSFSYEKAPVVNMLQNMEPFVCPFSGNPPTEKIKNWLRLYTARRALKRADRIIAISNFVKDFLVNQLHIDSPKIGLIYHGIDKNIGQPKRPVAIPQTCGDFLFTAGSIRPARGLEDILAATKYLANLNSEMPLVIAGNVDPVMINYQKSLKYWIDKNHMSANVVWAGNLDEVEMAWCYQNCSAFIMTSRVESFGLIALEAMSYGCLCISAHNPCLPEIFLDTAVYYNSGDGKELGDMITNVLSWDRSSKKRLSQRTLERASQFSWDVCAEKTVEQLQLAVEEFAKKKKEKHPV